MCMTTVLEILLIPLLAVAACYTLRLTVQSFCNLCELNKDRKSLPDSHVDCGGMVINKKKKKLEADNKPILPF